MYSNAQKMSFSTSQISKILLTIILSVVLVTFASAQSVSEESRVAVVANEVKTSIWVSGFPKNTAIIVYDNENNLLSILSTNNYGAAYLSFGKKIKTGVIVKTTDGGITVSNKTVIKNKQQEQNTASNFQEQLNKA